MAGGGALPMRNLAGPRAVGNKAAAGAVGERGLSILPDTAVAALPGGELLLVDFRLVRHAEVS